MLWLSRNREVTHDEKSAPDILSFGFRHGQLLVMISSNINAMRLFSGKRILVFEDSFLLSAEAQAELANAGATVVGPVATTGNALDALAAGGIDAVVMDVDLEPETVLPLIAKLEEDSVPFIFALSDNPRLDSQRFAGFVLSARKTDLSTIALALFLRESWRDSAH